MRTPNLKPNRRVPQGSCVRACLGLALGVWGGAALSCGSSPQTKTQVEVVYSARFDAEQGVKTEVVFPMPEGTLADQMAAQVWVTDGGTATLSSSDAGVGLSVQGKGVVEATVVAAFDGFSPGGGVPEVTLSRSAPDPGQYLFYVNKGGSALVQVDFSFKASRDCGGGCGGSRQWKYAGPVGLGPQPITVIFTEEQKK